MEFSKIVSTIAAHFFFMVAFTSMSSPISLAQNSPQDYLDAHNAARGEVGVVPMVWNDTVAAYAQHYALERAADCNLEHSSEDPYGENIAEASYDCSAGAAVQLWVDEKKYYDYATNTCAPDQVCGHYTQVVWNQSTDLGCAKVLCYNGYTFVTCNYYPPGNYIGERPY
ncbi:pathogenesis-related protein 1A-like [Malania oleifera]|uniref:pathogenesis-related protein 1A-like n=1 Tax=Malania oleifera TaxID=397392 RepID=UPI0025ADA158|nr:pathogenesis-related protein 1A-like [Malania oleifera]